MFPLPTVDCHTMWEESSRYGSGAPGGGGERGESREFGFG